MSRNDIPNDARKRRAYILYQLKLRGLSLRSIAKKLGVSPQAVGAVALGSTSLPIESALASAIGLTPQQLFREHYDSAGQRLTYTRPSQRKASEESCNVKSSAAA